MLHSRGALWKPQSGREAPRMADRRAKKKKRGSVAAISMEVRLMKAMAHPMRIQIVSEINKPGRLLSPARFAEAVDKPLSRVNYHFRELEKFECIEVAEEVPRRGAIEHRYRAVRRVLFDAEEWAKLPAIMRAGTGARA